MSDALKVDAELIRQLAKLLDETGLSEIEIGEGARHVRVARAMAAAPVSSAAPPAATTTGDGEIDAAHPGAVTSPMVGTLYLAPEPGAQPFVVAGNVVEAGDTLFVIEAMKTMNPVRAPRAGTVTRIFAANEMPVEYGEVLALID